MTDKPLVSIITPSYNQAPYLLATLESVAMQDYPHIQHIVMDGGSTDGSVTVLESWAREHPIIWRSERDGGQAAAIEAGSRLATGEVVSWLNSDDTYLDPQVVSDVVRLMADGAQIVTGGGWYLHEDGTRERLIPVHADRLDFGTLRVVDWVLQPATFVRRSLFLSCRIDTSLRYAFDWDLFVQLSKKAAFVPLDREIAGYRRHETGKTVSGGAERQRELLEVTRRWNGRRSVHYMVLFPVVIGHRIAGRLPRRIGLLATFVLNRFAELTHRVVGGKGIPY